MLTFKEWLVCDTMNEAAYERAYSLLVEAMSGDPSIDDPRRQEKVELKDAMVLLMWKAIINRQNDIERLKKIGEELKGAASSRPAFGVPRDQRAQSPRPALIEEATKLLEKLGYINKEKLKTNLSMSESDRTMDGLILTAIEWASGEAGNELPKGADESKVREMLSSKGSAPKDSFFRIIASHVENAPPEEQGLFQKDYDHHARKNQSRVNRTGGNATGHTTFEAPDIANSIALRLYDQFSKRQWGNASFGKIGNKDYGIRMGRPKGWSMPKTNKVNLKKVGNSDADIGSKEGSDDAYSYVRGSINNEPAKQRREMNLSRNPSSKSSDPVPYRKKRIQIINGDVKSWKAASEKYETYLSNLKGNPYEASYATVAGKKPSDDQLRHDMILDILHLNSHPAFAGRAGDPSQILRNLETYRDRFLKSSETPGMVVSALAGNEDKGGWGADDIRDRDEKLSQSDKSELKAGSRDAQISANSGTYDGVPLVSSNPQASVYATEDRITIFTRLLELMRQLKATKPEQVEALCIKFNMNPAFSSIRDVAGISEVIVGSRKTDADCESQLLQVGMPVKEVAEKLGMADKEATVRERITKGIKFLCQNFAAGSAEPRFRDMAASRGWVQQRASFAGAKPSPLSSMIRRKPPQEG